MSLAVIAAIVFVPVSYVLTLSYVDYWSPHGNLEVERADEKDLTFTAPHVGGADDAVPFSDCAFLLEIDKQTFGPMDAVLGRTAITRD